MATITAIQTGNWSSPTTWPSGILPTAADDVIPGNFIVTIDMDIEVNLMYLAGSSTGYFEVSTDRTITVNTITASSHTGSGSRVLLISGGGVTVNAIDIVGDSNANGSEPYAVEISGGTGHTLNVEGSIRGGAGIGGVGVCVSGDGVAVNVQGDIVGSTANSSHGLHGSGSGTTITVTGNISGGSGTSAYGLYNTGSTATITVTGNISGGSGTSPYGLYNLGNNTAVTVRGNFYACDSADGGTYAILMNTSGVGSLARLSGHAYSAGAIAGKGNNGYFPLAGQWCAIEGEDLVLHIRNDDGFPAALDGSPRILSVYGTNLPEASDVREGTLYGPEATLEGTLAVPPADAVAAGVPVDDTTGTAALRLSDLAAVTGAQIAAAVGA